MAVNLSDVIGAIPIVGIGLVGLVNWISAWKLLTMPYYITKPIVLLGLILYLVTKVPVTPARLPFVLGLLFSLLGDILLIPKGNRWFLAGMGAFSLTQLMYIWGFNRTLAPLPIMLVGIGVFVLAVVSIHLSVNRLAQTSSVQKNIVPFIKVYGSLVFAMTLSAILCSARIGWPFGAAAMAGVGGVLFLLSDGMIGMDKLDRRLPKYRFWIIFTYHIAQFLIAAAVIQLP